MRKILVLILALVLILGIFNSYKPQPAQGSTLGVYEGELSVRGTYLKADSEIYGPSAARPVEAPLIVNLISNGFLEGDEIVISYNGLVDGGDSLWNNQPPNYIAIENLAGVFSTSDQLLPITATHRVPGAIDAGDDYDT